MNRILFFFVLWITGTVVWVGALNLTQPPEKPEACPFCEGTGKTITGDKPTTDAGR